MGLIGQAVEDIAWLLCAWHRAQGDTYGSCGPRVLKDEFDPGHSTAVARRDVESCVRATPAVRCVHCDRLSQAMTGSAGNLGSVCGTCWLMDDEDMADNCLESLELVEGGVEFREMLLHQRTAPFAPNNREDPRYSQIQLGLQKSWPGRRLALETSAEITLLWDAQDPSCAAKAKAIRTEFPSLCHFVELDDTEAVSTLLARYPALAAWQERIRRRRSIAAVMAPGIFIERCEQHPKSLFYELLYRKTVRLPSEAESAGLDNQFLAPLRQLRVPGQARWWLRPEAVRQISSSLERLCFAMVDGFMPEAELRELRDDARRLFGNNCMRAGIEEQKGNYGGFWGDSNEGDILNLEGIPRKWSLEGDVRSWVGEDDERIPGLKGLTAATDSLVTALKGQLDGDCEGLSPAVSSRMRHIDFRESTMVACYPGDSCSRYLRHCDTGRGAALTTILYLNDDWKPECGGELRLYDEGFHNTKVKLDVAPIANRLILFWATEECPHEVLSSRSNRFAMTTWYRNSQCLGGSMGLADTALRCTPVSPLTLEEAVQRAGPPELRGERLLLLRRLQKAISLPEQHLREAALADVLRE